MSLSKQELIHLIAKELMSSEKIMMTYVIHNNVTYETVKFDLMDWYNQYIFNHLFLFSLPLSALQEATKN